MSRNINEVLEAISKEIEKEKENIHFDLNEEKTKWTNSGIYDGLTLAQEIIESVLGEDGEQGERSKRKSVL